MLLDLCSMLRCGSVRSGVARGRLCSISVLVPGAAARVVALSGLNRFELDLKAAATVFGGTYCTPFASTLVYCPGPGWGAGLAVTARESCGWNCDVGPFFRTSLQSLGL